MTDDASPQHELKLDRTLPLSKGMSRAFDDMIGYARSMRETVSTAPSKAVHEFRRTVRRATAQLELTGDHVRARQRKWVAAQLERANRQLSQLRDHGVLLPTLDKAASSITVDGAVERLRALLTKDRAAAESSEAPKAVDRNARALAGLSEIYEAGLQALDPEALQASLQRTYKKARSAFQKALKTRDDADFHRWRKAMKSVRYQLELLASGGEERFVALHQTFLAQTKELGKVTDLIALRDYVRESRKRIEGLDLRQVVSDLDALIRPRINEALTAAASAYKLKPRAFGRSKEAAAAEDPVADAAAEA